MGYQTVGITLVCMLGHFAVACAARYYYIFVSIATAGDCGGSGGQLQYYSGHGQLSVAASGNVTRRHASNMLLQQYKVCSALHVAGDIYLTA